MRVGAGWSAARDGQQVAQRIQAGGVADVPLVLRPAGLGAAVAGAEERKSRTRVLFRFWMPVACSAVI
ncbi:hypothetical protein GCM10014715_66250 [Streptomyces spiralis]|uniref:Uncharacterized protein n=1 Tax=Streptomyces spiralis TaxID=66376 RepID=A0A919AEH4_9ACTN|nr:hypothetical protein GCM10014715_66250 [Streptomyces spiralis]